MKILVALMMLGLACAPGCTRMSAQMPMTPPAALPDAAKANPVLWSAGQMYANSKKNILASGEEMPADKYSYHPTEGQKSFGWIMSHLAGSNGRLCAILSDGKAPESTTVAQTASKAELQAALKASFDYCDGVMAALTDAKLGDTVSFFGGAKVPRARVLFEISGDLMDHYSQMAAYLRGVGLLPPSATPPKPAVVPVVAK